MQGGEKRLLTVLSPLCSNVIKPVEIQFCTKPESKSLEPGTQIVHKQFGVYFHQPGEVKANKFIVTLRSLVLVLSFIGTVGRRRSNFMQLLVGVYPSAVLLFVAF